MKKILCALLVLCLAASLALSACKQADNKTAQATPSAVSSADPSDGSPEPTQEPTPVPKPEYEFDSASLAYSDKYVSFTLPAGQSCLRDATQPNDAIMRYLSFSSDDGGESGENTLYYVQNIGSVYDGAIYAYYTQEMFEKEFGAWNGSAVETLRFEPIESAGYSGVLYEYTVTYDGVPLRQLIWSVARVDGTALTIVYTFGDEAAIAASVSSIRVK